MSGVLHKTSSVGRLLVLLLAGAVLFRIGSALLTAGDTELTVWSDRDLWRALTMGGHWPVLGPEINGGLRPPGGAFYLLLGAIFAIQPSVLGANVGLILLFAASLALLGAYFAREVSPLAGALIAAALAGSLMLAEVLKVWNPGYLLFFATAGTVFGYHFLRTGQAAALAVAAAAIAIGLQIHTQIFQLAAGLAMATLLYRPRLTWRHAVALVAGLIVPYLPTLFGGGFGVIGSMRTVPSSAVDNYVLGGFHLAEKLQLVYGLLGGEDGVADLTSMPLGLASILRLANGLAVLSALAFCGWVARGRLRDPAGRPVGVFGVIALVAVGVALFSLVNARHMVTALPAVACMTGLAGDALVGRLERADKRWLAGVAVAFGGLVVCRAAILAAMVLVPGEFSAGSTVAQAEIAATVKQAFTADRETFENHAALFWRSDRGFWQLAQDGVTGQMAFVFETTKAAASSGDRQDCLAIVTKAGLTSEVTKELAKAAAFSGLSPKFGPMAAESEHFAYFPYTTADGNCLKSFPNAYIPTRTEAAVSKVAAGAPANRALADRALFAVPLAGEPFPLGLEISRAGQAYVATLHGRLLRGYTGLRFLSLVSPVLCVAGDHGTRVVSLGSLTVGSPQRGTLAPWQFPPMALADGTYRLWLIGRDGKTSAIVQEALGRLDVPAMTVAAPDGAAPPDGCPLLQPAGAR